MNLKRLDAIATGTLALIAGGVLILGMSGMFWQELDRARRQQEVLGTVVAQEKVKVCRQQQRRNPLKCQWWGTNQCAIVQYPLQTGEMRKLKECSLPLSNAMQVYVMYDSTAPADAKIALEAGENHHWVPLLFTGMPLVLGGGLLALGTYRLWQGIGWNK